MPKNYRDYDYFGNRPDVVRIFEDLEVYLDHCRFELLPFNPADLYDRSSYAWRSFEKMQKQKNIPPTINHRQNRNRKAKV